MPNMDTATLKGRLHAYIDQADNKHLEAIYLLLEKELEPTYQYDAATLELLYKRRENHLNEQSVSYSVEQAIDSIRKARNK